MKPSIKKVGWLLSARAVVLAGIVAPMLSGCIGESISSAFNTQTKFSSAEYGVAASPRVTTTNIPKGGGRYTVGQPYRVAGRWYTPADDPDYNATGKASWYGPNFHGRLTANGEIFDQFALTAAHPTLPLPSYVRVTNQGNGRSVLVRVNDRGPFAHGRVIDLSKRTAQVLDFIDQGTATVRVQYVGRAPVEGDDTRFLMASINTPTSLERGTTRFAMLDTSAPVPASAPTRMRSISGWVTDLLSYADVPESSQNTNIIIDSAHAAANAMAANDIGLDQWRDATEAEARKQNVNLGIFEDPANIARIRLAFAPIAAVDSHPITADGRSRTQLVLTYLKPGATKSDISAIAQELGLSQIILY